MRDVESRRGRRPAFGNRVEDRLDFPATVRSTVGADIKVICPAREILLNKQHVQGRAECDLSASASDVDATQTANGDLSKKDGVSAAWNHEVCGTSGTDFREASPQQVELLARTREQRAAAAPEGHVDRGHDLPRHQSIAPHGRALAS